MKPVKLISWLEFEFIIRSWDCGSVQLESDAVTVEEFKNLWITFETTLYRGLLSAKVFSGHGTLLYVNAYQNTIDALEKIKTNIKHKDDIDRLIFFVKAHFGI
ncbi:hypothetical protein D3C71_1604620 [compost metagenome]